MNLIGIQTLRQSGARRSSRRLGDNPDAVSVAGVADAMRRDLATWSSYVAHPRQLRLGRLGASGRLASTGRSTLRLPRHLLRL